MLSEGGFSFFVEPWVALKETQKVFEEGRILMVSFLYTVPTSFVSNTHTHLFLSKGGALSWKCSEALQEAERRGTLCSLAVI